MVPKLETRRIGGVEIFEIHGVFAEPWLNRNQDRMKTFLEEYPAPALLFNLREVEKIDDPGAETILRVARAGPKSALLGRNLPSYFVAEHIEPKEAIPLFKTITEMVNYFAKEFTLASEGKTERRQFTRIQTALAAEFEIQDFGQTFQLEAVVTNLSQGGLFAYFVDSRTEEMASRILDPFDLKLVRIRLYLNPNEKVETEGKVLRGEENIQSGSGIALEFYRLAQEDEKKIHAFLKSASKPKGDQND